MSGYGRKRCLGLFLLLAMLTGCRGAVDLEDAYGQRRGAGGSSVNGTSVLAGMFRQAGFQVSSVNRLSSASLHRCDVVVWAPDDFRPPDADVRQFFEEWFASDRPKTLVYIGRDYDAAPDYWEAVLASAPASERVALMRRRALAIADHEARRLDMPADATIEWFTMQRDRPPRKAEQLGGPWSAGVEESRTDIRTRGLLQIPTDEELEQLWSSAGPAADSRPAFASLLNAGPTVLVSRVTKPTWGGSQLIVVTNGSFLLNLPLVNHEHRKLAGHLIRACQPGSRVVFLESGPTGPRVFDGMTPPESSLRASREQVALLAHWYVLGLVYCLCVFPIFGRPKTLRDTAPAEFIQHVEALGDLLRRTRDHRYARRQIEHYYAITRRDPDRLLHGPAPAANGSRDRNDPAQEPAHPSDEQA